MEWSVVSIRAGHNECPQDRLNTFLEELLCARQRVVTLGYVFHSEQFSVLWGGTLFDPGMTPASIHVPCSGSQRAISVHKTHLGPHSAAHSHLSQCRGGSGARLRKGEHSDTRWAWRSEAEGTGDCSSCGRLPALPCPMLESLSLASPAQFTAAFTKAGFLQQL